MKHRYLLTCCLLFLSLLTGYGQNADQAKAVLDKTSDLLTKDSGIKATFKLNTYENNRFMGEVEGTLSMKGDRFLLEMPGITTWFNGTTQWTYLIESEEINISKPTEEELQLVHPYTFIHLYRKGYDCNLTGTVTYKGKKSYRISLVPQNKRSDIKRILLWITCQSYQPTAIEMETSDGHRQVVEVASFASGQKFFDSKFSLNTKLYPKAEIIDLR